MARSWRFVAPMVMAAMLITLFAQPSIAVTPVRHALLERHQTVE